MNTRILSLATLMAMGAIAFVGVSSAMAEHTALCKEDVSKLANELCPSGKLVSHLHETSVGHALLLSSFATIECEVLFLGDAVKNAEEHALGNPLIIQGSFTYTCLNGCTITEENGPAEIKILKLGHELAEVTGEWLLHHVCGLNCRYNGVGQVAHSLGPLLSGTLRGSTVTSGARVNKESGFLCPAVSELDITTEPLEHRYIGT